MTPQQQLADRLYELLPHKKELHFGTEVTWQYTHSLNSKSKVERVKKGIFCKYRDTTRTSFVVFFYGNSSATVVKKGATTIIGQKLGIADLLMATDFGVQIYGGHARIKVEVANMLESYNFEKDNILYQSDELCLLALDLLK